MNSFFPVFEQLLLVDGSPLDNHSECTRRDFALNNGQIIDINQAFIITILCMEVWWVVIIKVHGNDDPEKSTNLRHRQLGTWKRL